VTDYGKRLPNNWEKQVIKFNDALMMHFTLRSLIASVVYTAADCLKKWNNLRDMYVRQKGKKFGTGSAAPGIQRRQEQMMFLDECTTVRSRLA